MLELRERNQRGLTRTDWLKSYHTFSFGDYYDPRFKGFSDLRVINDDWIDPDTGFGTHGHRDMEIITYVLQGQVAHRDSMGNISTIQAGEFQRMTAGSGVTHSEFNPSPTDTLHLLQIWIFPDQKGLEPGYEQRQFAGACGNGQWHLVASPEGRGDSLTIHQDAELWLGRLGENESLSYTLEPGRSVWLHVVEGTIRLGEHTITEGDGVGLREPETLEIVGLSDQAEVLLFNLRT